MQKEKSYLDKLKESVKTTHQSKNGKVKKTRQKKQDIVSLEDQLKFVEEDSENLKLIKDPFEETIKYCLNDCGSLIKYVKDPTEEMQKIAIDVAERHSGSVRYIIKYLNLESEEIQLSIINADYRSFENIPNPTEKVKFAALEFNAFFISEIENPTEEMQLLAVKVDSGYKNLNSTKISLIKNPTVNVINFVIDNYFDNEYLVKHLIKRKLLTEEQAKRMYGHIIIKDIIE